MTSYDSWDDPSKEQLRRVLNGLLSLFLLLLRLLGRRHPGILLLNGLDQKWIKGMCIYYIYYYVYIYIEFEMNLKWWRATQDISRLPFFVGKKQDDFINQDNPLLKCPIWGSTKGVTQWSHPNGVWVIFFGIPTFGWLILNNTKHLIWLVALTILKNISQWEGLSHILWKNMFETTNQ